MSKTNNTTDLSNHLFAQMERLAEAKGTENLEIEVKRTNSIVDVAKQIIDNAEVTLAATKLMAEYQGLKAEDIPEIFAPANRLGAPPKSLEQ